MKTVLTLLVIVFLLICFSTPLFAKAEEHGEKSISIFLSIPFILMLTSIAIVPLKWEHWWENNWNKLLIALTLGIPMGIYFVFFSFFSANHSEEYEKIRQNCFGKTPYYPEKTFTS